MKVLRSTISALIIGSAAAHGTAVLADGKALYTAKNCHTCHGADGKAPIAPNYPKLSGQNAAYLEAQTLDIKSGKRANGLTAAMKPFVMTLTDAEIKQISQFLAGVK